MSFFFIIVDIIMQNVYQIDLPRWDESYEKYLETFLD